jgi:hypothetical protein
VICAGERDPFERQLTSGEVNLVVPPRSSPLLRGVAVAAVGTLLCPYPQTQFAESPGGSLLLIMIIVRLLPPEPVGWLAPPKFTRVGFGTRPIQFPHRPPLLTAVVQWTQDGFVVQEEKRTQVLDAGRPAPGQAGERYWGRNMFTSVAMPY